MVSDEWLEFLENQKKYLLGVENSTPRVELVKQEMPSPASNITWNEIEPFLADYPGYSGVNFSPEDLSPAEKVGDHWLTESPLLNFAYNSSAGPSSSNSIGYAALFRVFEDLNRMVVGLVVIDPPWTFAANGDRKSFAYQLTNQACEPDPTQLTVRSPDGITIRTPDGESFRVP